MSTLNPNPLTGSLDNRFTVEHKDLISIRIKVVQTRLEQTCAHAVRIDTDIVFGSDVGDLNHGAALLERQYGIRQTRGNHLHGAMIANSEKDARRQEDLYPTVLRRE
jgi:hypothetical protein